MTDRSTPRTPKTAIDRMVDLVLEPRHEKVTLLPGGHGLEVRREPVPPK
jgi:hypothetical protein